VVLDLELNASTFTCDDDAANDFGLHPNLSVLADHNPLRLRP
jgi:hypothetical protein